MKQVIFLIVIILWSVLQARRKALREAKRRQLANLPLPGSDNSYRSTPPVADEPYVDSDEPELPPEIQRMLQYSRQRTPAPIERQAEEVQPEVVETIVPTLAPESPLMADAYAIAGPTRRRFVFDREAVRTFVVTREVLGPPRSRKPFRIRPKAQE